QSGHRSKWSKAIFAGCKRVEGVCIHEKTELCLSHRCTDLSREQTAQQKVRYATENSGMADAKLQPRLCSKAFGHARSFICVLLFP
uniref:Uncharacterized protein n=1 Tax=Gallus gallus TaxID=9031 RepID=A0A8V0ZTH7_CHICK